MPDALSTLLRTEADAIVAAEPIPPLGQLSRHRPVPVPEHRRRYGFLAPALAAAVVAAVALGTLALHRPAHRAETFVVPPPPHLGQIVPPLVVRTRLGAPPGHVNGPPVDAADALAVSPEASDGLSLHTVGVVRPHATPDAQGNPRIDRCVYTYSDPDAEALHGRCIWALSTPETPGPPMTATMFGAPQHTWLEGTAPEGTAAVVLRSAGHDDVTVATADA